MSHLISRDCRDAYALPNVCVLYFQLLQMCPSYLFVYFLLPRRVCHPLPCLAAYCSCEWLLRSGEAVLTLTLAAVGGKLSEGMICDNSGQMFQALCKCDSSF